MKQTDKQIKELTESAVELDKLIDGRTSCEALRFKSAIKPFLTAKPIIAQFYMEGEYRMFIEETDEVKDRLSPTAGIDEHDVLGIIQSTIYSAKLADNLMQLVANSAIDYQTDND